MPAHARHPPAGHRPTFLHANGLGYRPSRAPSAGGAAAAVRHAPTMPVRTCGQLAATKESLRYWLTACSGTRKERPTRIASSSPEWTSRYTVILDTRMIEATSATV